jgi:hypothetical protein
MEGKAETVDLSIIIVNWNTRDSLRACLQSIYAYPPRKYTFEVIVVDNASADKSADMVRREFPQVRVIANDHNYGFAKATNQGYRVSRGAYVMALNPDAEVLEGTLDGLVEFLETHPDAGAVQPCPAGAVQPHPAFFDFPKYPKLFILQRISRVGASRWMKKGSGDARQPFEVTWLKGTGITCRRDTLGPDSFFDEWSFLYYEEYWLSKRLRERGSKLYVAPNLRIHHIGGASLERSPEYRYRTTLLLVAGGHVVLCRAFGSWIARLHAIVHLLDGLIVWPILRLKQRFRKDSLRAVALAEWRAIIYGNWWNLLHGGEEYFRKVSDDTERFFNRGHGAQSV